MRYNNEQNGVTPLMAAASAGHCDTVGELIAAGAALDCQDKVSAGSTNTTQLSFPHKH